MGYIRHDAIIVVGWDASLERAHAHAAGLSLPVSEIVISPLNHYRSFLIAPDGSKEGWEESEKGDWARQAWKDWIKQQEDFYVDWVHVSLAGDEATDTRIVEQGRQ